MKYIFFILFLSHLLIAIGQDFDIYKKNKNDNYKLPDIASEMTYQEFELLSQNMRMKDMMYASIVPGYIHFKAQEKKHAYWLLGLRGASYITMAGIYLGNKDKLFQIDESILNQEKLDKLNTNKNIFYAALALASATYLYDIIHGEWILNQKQEKIRYKYSIKASKSQSFYEKDFIYPTLSCTIQF